MKVLQTLLFFVFLLSAPAALAEDENIYTRIHFKMINKLTNAPIQSAKVDVYNMADTTLVEFFEVITRAETGDIYILLENGKQYIVELTPRKIIINHEDDTSEVRECKELEKQRFDLDLRNIKQDDSQFSVKFPNVYFDKKTSNK